MRGKKGIFGYKLGLTRLSPKPPGEWFDPASFLIKSEETLPEEDEAKPHYFLGKMMVIFAALVLILRLTNLQVTQGYENRYLAEGNRIRRQITVAPRGAIVDRTGAPLVTNKPGYSLDIIPSDLPIKKVDRQIVYEAVAKVVNLPLDAIADQINQAGLSSLDPVTIKGNLAREEALVYEIRFNNLAGVRVSYTPSRQYDMTSGLSHLIGYTSRMTEQDVKKHPDYSHTAPIGRSGLESSFDTVLRGQEGITEIEVNANGQYQRSLHDSLPKIGQTLQLTLDVGLQQEMAAALEEAMQKNGVKQSVGIAMDPHTGGILASVSLPNYDNNIFAQGMSGQDLHTINNNPDKPLLNRAVDGLYPAGSTIKPFVATAALQEGTIKPNTTLDTSIGKIKIGQWEFPDWKVHGTSDVKQAIAESNDIFFYALGGGWDKIPGLGVERLRRYYQMFGFGQETGVDYTSEQTGLVPDPEWKKKVKKESWYIGDTYHIAIGQGDLLVTPIQLARALSSIANGGNLVTPHIVASVEDPETEKIIATSFTKAKMAVSWDVLQTVRDGMHRTVDSETGSARSLHSLPFSSAGKTGTAQFGTEAKTHAWYIGYAPFDNPKIVVAVLVEGGGEGNAISVPVAGRVFQYHMSHQ